MRLRPQYCRAHPCACGENLPPHALKETYTGSPPHMQGRFQGVGKLTDFSRLTPVHAGKMVNRFCCSRGKRITLPDELRLTPAYAGKIWYLRLASNTPEAHPRACGEDSGERVRQIIEKGSPPHMRGRCTSIMYSRTVLRLTPAHAGKIEFGYPEGE